MRAELPSRREFLRLGVALAGAALIKIPARLLAQEEAPRAAPVNPTEDLMREHGVLSRILLIYETLLVPLRAGRELSLEVLGASAGIVRRFIQDYHEALEEDYVFPRFEKAGRLVELVGVLREQHRAGRRLTECIARATPALLGQPGGRQQVADSMLLFIRMYRPHKAREDTVLFPAFHRLLSPAEFDRLGEVFEERERKLFGPNGFENVVGQVAGLEKTLGIYELDQFTPPGAGA
jgi:hemerythrin-like domain-containing protein